MNKNREKIEILRIERFIDRLAGAVLGESVLFDANFAWCQEPIPFADRLKERYQPIFEGEIWGQAWESAWFHLRGRIPQEWQGRKVVAHLDFTGEGLVYDGQGNILQGITNGSVFKEDFARDVIPLLNQCQGGEEVELWVETAANGLFGVYTEPDPSPDAVDRYGHYQAEVKSMRLRTFDVELWGLWLDFRILAGLIKTLPEKSVHRARIIHVAGESIDAYDGTPACIYKCKGIISRELGKPAAPSDLKVTAVGHAHIDTAWLWPVGETIRKCARTFANQLALIEKYPDYVFGASQPQHYAFGKEHYPDLYDKIKQAVAEGRWELQGGMWVEADCNIPSGESLIRQILHGKNFFKDEFGVEVENCWLPDVFGYPASLPQLLKRSGLKFFLTQKLSWNQINEFPHHTFLWRGIDGSEVMCHFPPENTYNSQLGTDYLVPAQEHFKEKGFLDEFLSLFGVGDGGGGPKEENIELGLRQKNLEGSPRVEFGKASDFFKRLSRWDRMLPKWVGELYFELHRGTLTTQARTKQLNRRLENHLREVELLWSWLPLEQYPAQDLDRIWKTMLRNQFHDILPGSSITRVYEETNSELTDALQTCSDLCDDAGQRLFQQDAEALTLVNGSAYTFQGAVVLPEKWHSGVVDNDTGEALPVQKEANRLVVRLEVKPYTIVVLRKSQDDITGVTEQDDLVLENDQVRYEFTPSAVLLKAIDKKTGREILQPGKAGNLLTLYDDHPTDWDAWDISPYYEKHVSGMARQVEVTPRSTGPVRQSLTFKLEIGDSQIEQTVILEEDSQRLDFVGTVNWREKHKMLRVAFPVNVQAEQASYDIQYGYCKRNTHRNTTWDEARFESAAHRYVDLSDHDYGVALLNDCKYGYKVHDNVLDLNLLRAPTYPDPDADQGEHSFTYSLYPHAGDLIRSDVIARADHLNRGLILFDGFSSGLRRLPWRVEGKGLSLEVVKRAEKEDCLILRVVETLGRRTQGKLILDQPGSVLVETDLMEWVESEGIPIDGALDIELGPFEIRTWKLK